MAKNNKPSLKPKKTNTKKNSLKIPQIDLTELSKLNLKSLSNINLENLKNYDLKNMGNINKNTILIFCFIILLLIMIFTVNSNNHNQTVENNTTIEEIVQPTTVMIGNNSLGYVVKEGPYGNTSSNVKITYILGVHPREKGAHRLMEQALKEKEDNLKYCYYIYKVNVTENPTDFSASRMNGQKLAKEFIVNDAISNNFTFAVDSHYSNGAWGVQRFIFTPNKENELSYALSQSIADNFDWIKYFTPENPTSPYYLTSPLNQGGVAAVIYEAYTEDNHNVTLEHDKELVEYIDNWNFSSSVNNTTS